MNFKIASMLLIVLLLAVTSVSAANENITDNDNILSVNVEENFTLDNNNDLASASQDINLSSSDEEAISASQDMNLSSSDEEAISALQDNISISHIDAAPLSVSVNSDSSMSAAKEPEPSMSVSSDDAKLTGIYDKVYSSKKWKSIKLTKFKVRKSWSQSKRDYIINKKYRAANKKVGRYVSKYAQKGWTFNGCRWRWHVGTYKVSYLYYAQFYKTVYYHY